MSTDVLIHVLCCAKLIHWACWCSMEMRKSLSNNQVGLNFAETNAHISQKWKVYSYETILRNLRGICSVIVGESVRRAIFCFSTLLLYHPRSLLSNIATISSFCTQELSEKDKEVWNEKAAVLKKKYDADMEEYRSTLPELSA